MVNGIYDGHGWFYLVKCGEEGVHAQDREELLFSRRGREICSNREGVISFFCSFCTSVTLSLLDLLGRTTVLNEVSAALEDAMVELASWVIDLWGFT